MLIGVLNTRDVLVSFEPYCTLDSSSASSHSSSTSKYISQFYMFYNDAKNLLTTDSCWMSSIGKQGEELLEYLDRPLRHCLMLCLLCAASDDLPPYLAALIAIGLREKQGQLEALHLARSFLSSRVEDAVCTVTSFGMLGILGHPQLLTPHLQRDGNSYDEHVRQCRLNYLKLAVDDQEPLEDSGGLGSGIESSMDLIAMMCRHSRVDVFVRTLDVIETLAPVIIRAAAATDDNSDESNAYFLTGAIAVDICTCLVHKSKDLVATDQSMIFLFKPAWQVIEDVLLGMKKANDSKSMYCISILQLIANIILRQKEASTWFLDKSILEVLKVGLESGDILRTNGSGSLLDKLSTESTFTVCCKLVRILCLYDFNACENLLGCFISPGDETNSGTEYSLENRFTIKTLTDGLSLPHKLNILHVLEDFAFIVTSHLQCMINKRWISPIVINVALWILKLSQKLVKTYDFSSSDRLTNTSVYNFLATVIGIQLDCGSVSEFFCVRGKGLCCVIIESTKAKKLSEQILVQETQKLRSELEENIESLKLLSETNFDLTRDQFFNFVSCELNTSKARVIAGVMSLSIQPLTLSIDSNFIPRISQQYLECRTSDGLMISQICRTVSVFLLSNVCIIYKTTSKNKFTSRLCEVAPLLTKTFTYNLIGLLSYVCTEVVRKKNDFKPIIQKLLLGIDQSGNASFSFDSRGLMDTTEYGASAVEDVIIYTDRLKQYFQGSIEDISALKSSEMDSTSIDTRGIPVLYTWPYLVANVSSDDDFFVWSRALLEMEVASASADLTDDRFTFSFFPIGTRVYFFVDSVINFCSRIDDFSGAYSVEEQDKYVDTFETLFSAYVPQIFVDPHFSDTFLQAMMSRRSQSLQASSNKSLIDSATRLTESVIENAISFTFDNRVHTSVLLILSTPTLHWRIRETIWKQLGSLGLLHLLESPATELYLANLLRVRESNISVVRYMVLAMNSLRTAEDRMWLICGVALYHIAAFVANSDSEESAGAKIRSIGLRKDDDSWLFLAISSMQMNYISKIESLIASNESYCKINTGVAALLCRS